jgi:hypothetical protein
MREGIPFVFFIPFIAAPNMKPAIFPAPVLPGANQTPPTQEKGHASALPGRCPSALKPAKSRRNRV